jgi:hypothetical protein
MNHRALPFASLLACLPLAACSSTPDTSTSSAGGGGSASASTTSSSTGEGGSGGGGGSSAGSTTPIDAAKEQWTWVPFDDAFCANGSQTGIGVNLTDKSKRVVIYLQGGGACWDDLTCYTLKIAANFDGYGEAKFADEAQLGASFFNRADPLNPFKDYNFVYVPYCTGDVHAGSNTITYGTKPTMHVGFTNMGLFLKRLAPTFPDAERVFLAGSSAGGFGSLANWWRTQDAFGKTRVDLIDDSGTPLPLAYENAATREQQRTSWNLKAATPPGCPECETDLTKLFSFYSKAYPDHRGALLSYAQDTVLSQFSQITPAKFEMGLEEMTKAEIDPIKNLHYFIFNGMGHVLWFSPLLATKSVSVQAWLTLMVNDSPDWTSQHP